MALTNLNPYFDLTSQNALLVRSIIIKKCQFETRKVEKTLCNRVGRHKHAYMYMIQVHLGFHSMDGSRFLVK